MPSGAALLSVTASVQAADKKPNILVIWGDDIGTWNISHNNRGMMGYPPSATAGSFSLSKMQKQIEELSKAH